MTDQEKLAQKRLEHHKEIQRINAFEDLTPEAKTRRVREAQARHRQEYAEEVARFQESLASKKAGAQRTLDTIQNPRLSAEESSARSLRRMELREELTDLFDRGPLSRDPVQEYEQAIARGDAERAQVIAEIAPRYLRGEPFRQRRLNELVEANQPAAAKEAKEKITKLEAEERSADFGRALWQRIGARRSGGS